jgi:hypothetical protein
MSGSDEGPRLTLVIATDEAATEQELFDRGSESYGPAQWLRRRIASKKDVELSDVKAQLDKVQDQITALLENIQDSPRGRFRLHEVEVGLAVTAEGSIGVATVGAEVSLSLTFACGNPTM